MAETMYEFVDMIPFIRRHQLGNKDDYCYGGMQLGLLRDAFDVEWVVCDADDDYEGYWYAVFILNGLWCVVNGYFGSCARCDSLVDTDPYEWLVDYVKNVRGFASRDDLIEWLEVTEDYSYGDIKQAVINATKEYDVVGKKVVAVSETGFAYEDKSDHGFNPFKSIRL